MIFEGVLRVADLGLRRLGDLDADGNAKGGMVTDCSLDDEDFDCSLMNSRLARMNSAGLGMLPS